MAGIWTALDDLIRELAAIRHVAPRIAVDGPVRQALEDAIASAAQAIDFTIDAPGNAHRLLAARQTLGVCSEMVRALDGRQARGLRSPDRGDATRSRALELIETARDLPKAGAARSHES